jgi:hypothetical protein
VATFTQEIGRCNVGQATDYAGRGFNGICQSFPANPGTMPSNIPQQPFLLRSTIPTLINLRGWNIVVNTLRMNMNKVLQQYLQKSMTDLNSFYAVTRLHSPDCFLVFPSLLKASAVLVFMHSFIELLLWHLLSVSDHTSYFVPVRVTCTKCTVIPLATPTRWYFVTCSELYSNWYVGIILQ